MRELRSEMRTFPAQLRRDLAEWWPLAAAAVFAGLVPLLLPLVTSVRGEAALDLRQASAVVGGGLFWLAAVALLGDGLAARDLAEGRLSFFVSRPVTARCFWLARVAAALLLLATVSVCLWLPSELVGTMGTVGSVGPKGIEAPDGDAGLSAGASTGASLSERWTVRTSPLTAPGVDLWSEGGPYGLDDPSVLRGLAVLSIPGLLGLVVTLLLLAHLVSTAARSRDAWTLLDFAGASTVGALALGVRETLLSAQAFAALVVAERLFVIVAAGVLLWAGSRQLFLGRIHLARGHGALSRRVWAGLAAAALLGLLAARWVTSPAPEDLRSVERLVATGDGSAALVSGRAAYRLGMPTAVVFSADSGGQAAGPTSAAVGPVQRVAAAAETDRFAWTRCRRFAPLDCEVWTADGARAGATGISVSRWDHELALSPHGELLAVAHERLEVWQLGGEPRLVLALDRSAARPAFLSARRLRYLEAGPDLEEIRLEEVDLPSRTVRSLGTLPGEMPVQLVTSPTGRYVASVSIIPTRVAVLDAESGRVRDLGQDPLLDGHVRAVRFVAGDDGAERLYLLADGAPESPLRLVRVDPASLFQPTTDASSRLVALPPTASTSSLRLGALDGRLLLGGHAIWRLGENQDDGWSPLATGVRLPYRALDLAPSRDTAVVLAGDGAVLRLSKSADRLRILVPPVPGTAAGSFDRPTQF